MPGLKHNAVEVEFILENNKKISELVNDIDDDVTTMIMMMIMMTMIIMVM